MDPGGARSPVTVMSIGASTGAGAGSAGAGAGTSGAGAVAVGSAGETGSAGACVEAGSPGCAGGEEGCARAGLEVKDADAPRAAAMQRQRALIRSTPILRCARAGLDGGREATWLWDTTWGGGRRSASATRRVGRRGAAAESIAAAEMRRSWVDACRRRIRLARASAGMPRRARGDVSDGGAALPEQARSALVELLRGFQAADEASRGRLLEEAQRDGKAEVESGLVAALLQLVFLLYAEDLGLLPSAHACDSTLTGLFDELCADASRDPGAMQQRFGAWARIVGFFRRVHNGAGHGWGWGRVRPPGRQLFDPDAYPFLEGRARGSRRAPEGALEAPQVSDEVVHRALAGLLVVNGERIAYRALDVEVFGSVYEALMCREQRRRRGSHYTPRALVEPIVATTLRPLFDAMGAAPRPSQILALKVCDPAMGSGAFLSAACRALGDALLSAWQTHGMPAIPPGEDAAVHARRAVAHHCLYGIDKDPLAVELAKLSLWLMVRAADHPFTFLDHALRQGDSLVGLSRSQVRAFTWEDGERAPSIREDVEAALKEERRDALAYARYVGDRVIDAFFSETSDRARRQRRRRYAAALIEPGEPIPEHDARPSFHWEIELPEVFGRENPGFDAFVGNPPFLGGKRIRAALGEPLKEWLLASHEGASGNADLAAYFFRRCFEKLRRGGTFGLVATNTIAQGDTRAAGLLWIRRHGGRIYCARRRLKWPGAASVVVSVVHVQKGAGSCDKGGAELDGRPVERISAFLFHRGGDEDPTRLSENRGICFSGCDLKGQGFVFDDADPAASPLSDFRRILEERPSSEAVVRPYMGGEEIAGDPRHAPRRRVIAFGDWALEDARAFPELLSIVERKVKPERRTKAADVAAWPWWQFWRIRRELYETLRARGCARALVGAQVSNHLAFALCPSDIVFAHTVNVLALSSYGAFAVLQSRVHEVWARLLGSSMKDDLRYTPSDCFETFPFPLDWQRSARLEDAGRVYYEYRAGLMADAGVRARVLDGSAPEGLTATYNRFHNPAERGAGIEVLRALHAAMDRAVLDAYGFIDIDPACEFLLDYEEEDGGGGDARGGRVKRRPFRYRWPDEVRDEVLTRLLALNAERAEKGGAAGRARGGRARRAPGAGVTGRLLLAVALACGCRGPEGIVAPARDAGIPPAARVKPAIGDGSLSITLAPVPVEDAPSLRRTALAEVDGQAEIFTSVTLPGPPPRTVVSSRPAGEGAVPWTQRLSLTQLLPPPPAWDVETSAGGAPWVVIERAGGAMNQLSLLGPGGELALTRLPLGSYGEPRFVRRMPSASGQRTLTAILDGERLVAFEVAPSGACAPIKVVGNAVSGVAVRRDGSYALFFKEHRSGPVRGVSTAPGVLRQIDLGPRLEPAGPILSPLGETVVYEVDADAAGDALAIVATVPEGLLVVVGAPSGGAWSTATQQLIRRSAPLFWPSVLATADGLLVAAVEIGEAGQARLLVGRAVP